MIYPMKHESYFAAAVLLLVLSQFGVTSATGENDGEWSGSATSVDWRCKPASLTLTVQGKIATGQAKFQVETANIHGTVSQDGTLGGTIGFRHLTGQFIEDEFEGTFKSPDCAWKVLLKRKKPP
jgi:hypothetical protein